MRSKQCFAKGDSHLLRFGRYSTKAVRELLHYSRSIGWDRAYLCRETSLNKFFPIGSPQSNSVKQSSVSDHECEVEFVLEFLTRSSPYFFDFARAGSSNLHVETDLSHPHLEHPRQELARTAIDSSCGVT